MGIPKALKLYVAMYSLASLTILLAIIVGILPKTVLLMLVIAPLIIKNIRTFLRKQDKRETFILSVNNLMLYNGALAITMVIGLILR